MGGGSGCVGVYGYVGVCVGCVCVGVSMVPLKVMGSA